MDSDVSSDWDGSIGFIRRITTEEGENIGPCDGEELDLQADGGSRRPGDGLEDSGSETDLEEETVDQVVGKIDKTKGHLEAVYKKACHKLGIIPCSPFLRQIYEDEIDLSHYNIGPVGAKAAAKTMRENTTTMLLNVHDNGIGAVGAKAFAGMLADNSFITVLDMSMNFMGQDGFEALSDMLKNNRFIVELNFATTKLNNSASVFIGKAIEQNTTLLSLDLSSNEIGDEGSICIAKGIKANKSILFLNLGCNHIRGKGATAIANALITNSTLRIIDLNSNGFADFGTRAIGNALKVNQCLRELDISQNRITAEGAWALSIGLEENVGLKVLKIGGNPFQSRGATSIVDSLITNKDSTVEELYFDDVVVSGDFEKLLLELLDQREGLYVQFGTVVKGKEHKRRGKQQKVSCVVHSFLCVIIRQLYVLSYFNSVLCLKC